MAEDDSAERPTTLIVCVNHRFRSDEPSCAARGSLALAEAVERGVRERRIDVRVERIRCLGRCARGPSMRLAPGGAFFLGVTAAEIAGILDTLAARCGIREEDQSAALPAHLLGS